MVIFHTGNQELYRTLHCVTCCSHLLYKVLEYKGYLRKWNITARDNGGNTVSADTALIDIKIRYYIIIIWTWNNLTHQVTWRNIF